MKIFLKTLQALAIGALIIASLLLIFTTVNFRGFQLFVVRSGSMEPTIKTGAVVFDIKKSAYSTGDIITFHKDGTTITHRIQEEKDGKFIVKGDANNSSDPDPVEPSKIIGKVSFSLPYLGYFVEFLRSFAGLIIFIIVPATIITYEEIQNITKEIKVIRQKKSEPKKDVPTAKIISSALLIAALIGLTASSTSAYFSDTKIVTGNVFSTGYWGLIISEAYPTVDEEHGSEGKNDWIELYNPTPDSINLKGYTLITKMGYFKIATNSVIIPPQGKVILSHDQSTVKFWERGKEIVNITLPGNYDKDDWLISRSDQVTLKDAGGHTVDEVTWEKISVEYSAQRVGDQMVSRPDPTPGY